MYIDSNIAKYNIIFFLRALILLTPIMLLFYQENGLTSKELFFFQGIFYLTSILFEIPVGYLSNNLPRKLLLTVSFLIYFSICVLWLTSYGYFVILTGEILFAISKIMMDNAMSGYLYDYLEQKNKQLQMPKYFGYLNFYLAFGTTIAAILGTFIYYKFGSKTILLTELIISIIIVGLTISLPNIKPILEKASTIKNNLIKFYVSLKFISKKEELKYHILLSGLLTACSILFALTFQPLVQNSMFPVFMFGVVAFLNHFTRSIASIIAGKFAKTFNITKLATSLLILFSISFLLILNAFKLENKIFTFLSITSICLFIGLQLIFTILHISRLHSLVTIKNRGSLMSVNNIISRTFTALILISSELFIHSSDFNYYFYTIFIIFVIGCSLLVKKLKRIEGKI